MILKSILILLSLSILFPGSSADHGIPSNRFMDYRDMPMAGPMRDISASLNSFSALSKAIDDTLRTMGLYLPGSLPEIKSDHHGRLPPSIHARESDAERVFFIDLPGFHRSEVKVELVRGRVVSVWAERNCDENDVYCIPRAVRQDFNVEEDIDVNKITVNLDSGELRIHLPKKSATRFTIPIVDRLLGLNQPSHDKEGEKVPIHSNNKSPDKETEGEGGDIQWPDTVADIRNSEEYQQYLNTMHDAAGRVAQFAEEMREHTQKQGSQWIDQVHRAAEMAGDSANHIWNAGARKAAHGSETIKKSSEEVRDSFHWVADQAQDKVKGHVDNAKKSAKEVGDAVKDKAKVLRDTAKERVVDPAKEATEETVEDVKGKAGGLLGWFGDFKSGVQEAAQGCINCAEEGYKEGKAKHYTERQKPSSHVEM